LRSASASASRSAAARRSLGLRLRFALCRGSAFRLGPAFRFRFRLALGLRFPFGFGFAFRLGSAFRFGCALSLLRYSPLLLGAETLVLLALLLFQALRLFGTLGHGRTQPLAGRAPCFLGSCEQGVVRSPAVFHAPSLFRTPRRGCELCLSGTLSSPGRAELLQLPVRLGAGPLVGRLGTFGLGRERGGRWRGRRPPGRARLRRPCNHADQQGLELSDLFFVRHRGDSVQWSSESGHALAETGGAALELGRPPCRDARSAEPPVRFGRRLDHDGGVFMPRAQRAADVGQRFSSGTAPGLPSCPGSGKT